MDYATRTRIKIWGRAEFVEDDPELLDRLVDPSYGAVPERAIRFHVEAWDANCRQHIPELLPASEVEALRARIAGLEGELETMREDRAAA